MKDFGKQLGPGAADVAEVAYLSNNTFLRKVFIILIKSRHPERVCVLHHREKSADATALHTNEAPCITWFIELKRCSVKSLLCLHVPERYGY
jgi:hypothetical protein